MYNIGNMLIQLKNAQVSRQERASVPFSKVKYEIAKVLKENDFVQSVDIKKKKMKKSEVSFLDVKLKYVDGQGAISGVKFLSKPSRRLYIKSKDIRPVKSGYGILILSTPKGILVGKDARKQKLGGEVIAEIW